MSRVAGGAVAQALLAMHDISVRAYTVEIGGVPADVVDPAGAQERMFFSPDPDVVPAWESLVHDVRAEGDTLGGIVQVEATGVPAGLGEPVFDKLDALLAHALMSVGAVKAVEVGAGLEAARLRGSENNDPIVPGGFHTNHAGGILGGISNGQPIVVRAAVKPIPSIAQEQITIDTNGRPAPLRVGGRHDICAIPRVVPVLKAMAFCSGRVREEYTPFAKNAFSSPERQNSSIWELRKSHPLLGAVKKNTADVPEGASAVGVLHLTAWGRPAASRRRTVPSQARAWARCRGRFRRWS